MYRSVFLIPFLILGLSCAQKGVEIAEEETPVDTLMITEVAAEVETVYVTTVETVVETVRVVEEGVPASVPDVVVIRAEAFKVQIGAFEIKENADRLYDSLKDEYGDLIYIENIPPYWKVRIGNYKDSRKALLMRDEMRGKGYSDTWIVPK